MARKSLKKPLIWLVLAPFSLTPVLTTVACLQLPIKVEDRDQGDDLVLKPGGQTKLPKPKQENKPNPARELDRDNNPEINGSYQTLSNRKTKAFWLGRSYSANDLGIDKPTAENCLFKVVDIDDLAGTLTVDVYLKSKPGSTKPVLLTSRVPVHGFKKTTASELLNWHAIIAVGKYIDNDVIEIAPSTAFVPPSVLASKKNLSVNDLHLESYFKYRRLDHRIEIKKFDDKRGTLEGDIFFQLQGKEDRCVFKILIKKLFVFVQHLGHPRKIVKNQR